jgi:hypothetical protein
MAYNALSHSKVGKGICPCCGARQKRSNQQNRRLHEIFRQIVEWPAVSKKGFTVEQVKSYLKDRYLGYDEIRLPNGKLIQQLRSTAELNTEELNQFMLHCEMWCAEVGIPLNFESDI